MQAQVSNYRSRRIAAWLLGLVLLVASGIASADPPSRVARLGYLSGTVSFNAAGDDEWVQATRNRPLTTGDRVWADQGSRAEVQAGAAIVRMSAGTDLSLLNLDDRTTQLQLTQGVLNVRLRRSAPDQVYEIDTPNLALTMREPAVFRVEVDPDGNATSVFVRSGQVEVYGEGASYVLDAQHPYRFTGTGLREYEPLQLPPPDEFDRWAGERDRAFDSAASTRYVSPEVVGYEELDAYGTWQSDPSYGNVWVPTRVSADWAPYRDGHWAWVDPWGWTWIDDAPWGFAVTHYGRWAHVRQRWCWVPGPVQVRPYYAPALVAFVGGDNFSLSISTGTVGGVAWFPLAPREVYRPAYAVSRSYYENVNVSNTVINTTVINNTYNTTNVTNVVYANRQVPGAVVAVPQTAFVQSQPVAKAAVRVPQEHLVSRPVAVAPSVAPSDRSLRGHAEQANKKPPSTAIERTVVAREAPPAAHPKFEPSQQTAAVRPEEPRKETRPAAQGPKPNVKVIAKQEEGRPMAAPPPTAVAKPGGKTEEQARGRDEGKGQARAPDEGKEQARGRDEGKGPPRGPDEGKEQARGRDEGKGPPRAVANAPATPGPAQRAPTPPDSEQQVPPTPTPAPEQRSKPGQPEAPRPPVPRNSPEPAKPPAVVAPQPERPARPAVPRPPETRPAPDERDRSSQRERDQRERAQPAPRSPATSPPAQARVPESPPAPRPLPTPAEPRRPDPRDRAEPPAPRPAAPPSPQAKVNPPPQEAARPRAEEAPRPRAEPPRPREDVARPPSPQPAPPPAARAEPRPPAGMTPPQAHPAPQPRPNERKKNEEPDRGEKK